MYEKKSKNNITSLKYWCVQQSHLKAMPSGDIKLWSRLSEEKYDKEFRETFQRTFNSIFTLFLTRTRHTMIPNIKLHVLYF
jgi:hypothetical protein